MARKPSGEKGEAGGHSGSLTMGEWHTVVRLQRAACRRERVSSLASCDPRGIRGLRWGDSGLGKG